ncbi:hypothetical protein L9F63_028155, partial [Diploptera punctata]
SAPLCIHTDINRITCTLWRLIKSLDDNKGRFTLTGVDVIIILFYLTPPLTFQTN